MLLLQIMDGDLLFHLEQAWDQVAIVQLADNPGRLEPGIGEINFESVRCLLVRRSYQGLVELEYGQHEPGAESELRGLEKLPQLKLAARGNP